MGSWWLEVFFGSAVPGSTAAGQEDTACVLGGVGQRGETWVRRSSSRSTVNLKKVRSLKSGCTHKGSGLHVQWTLLTHFPRDEFI